MTYKAAQQYAARKKRGRPQINLTLSQGTVDAIDELAKEMGGNRSTVITEAINRLRGRGQGAQGEPEDP